MSNYNLMPCFRQVKEQPRHYTSGRTALFYSGFDFHPSGQGEGDPVRHFITPAVRFFVPADQCTAALVVLCLVLGHSCVLAISSITMNGLRFYNCLSYLTFQHDPV